jgi:hypothetical protein
MALILVHFPCDNQRHDQFCALFDFMLSSINPNKQIVVGGDINARISVHTCDKHKEVLGPYGIARSNIRGNNLLHTLVANTMQVKNTFFHHPPEEYATYTSLPTTHHPHGIPSMHDIFACSQSLHKLILDCQMVLHGIASNHHAVRLKIALLSVKFKARAASWGTINWPKILSDKHTHIVYNKHLLSLTTPDMDYDRNQEVILQAGALTATHHKCQCKGWFQMSRTTLAPLLKERNQVLHATKCTHLLPAEIQATMQADLKHLNCHIAHAVLHAKAVWYADVCSKIK